MQKELNFRADKSKIAWIIFGVSVRRLFFGLPIVAGFNILTNFDYSLMIISAILSLVIFILYVLRKINGLQRAKVYIYDNRIFIRTPLGEHYDLDVVENDLRKKWVGIGRRFLERNQTYQYGLGFQTNGKEVGVSLDWLKEEHRQRIFSQIAYLHNEATGDFELHFPIEFEVLKENVAGNIHIRIAFKLFFYGIFGLFMASFVRALFKEASIIIANVSFLVTLAYIIHKPIIELITVSKYKSRIPSRIEINEMGICFDEEEIFYEDMLSVTIYGLEKSSLYSFCISTETEDYPYALGQVPSYNLESIYNENYQPDNLNEKISFSKIFKKVILESDVEYYEL